MPYGVRNSRQQFTIIHGFGPIGHVGGDLSVSDGRNVDVSMPRVDPFRLVSQSNGPQSILPARNG